MKKTIKKVLVINSGSSSLKYQLFDMQKCERLAKGLVERIGCGGPKDHTEALKKVVADLGEPKDIDAIGHRVLHGAEVFKDSVKVDAKVLAKLDKLVKFGPLHMPANIGGIRACQKIFKGVPNVAVFDTAFHQTMPDCAAMYAIDPKYYKKMGIRKYGFHGTSHKFIVAEAAKFLKKPVSKVNLVTCHMGNGSSLAAVKGGQCVDTTMGLTPLAGLVMGTRCGDIDAAAVLTIMEAEKRTPAEMDTLLNKKSGLLALTGSSDCRDICASVGRKSSGGMPRSCRAAGFAWITSPRESSRTRPSFSVLMSVSERSSSSATRSNCSRRCAASSLPICFRTPLKKSLISSGCR